MTTASEKTSTLEMSVYFSSKTDYLEEGVSRLSESILTASHMLKATLSPYPSSFL